MNNIKYLIFLMVIFLTGCFNPPVITKTNMAENYHGKIKSLSIIYLGNKFGANESDIEQNYFQRLSIPFRAAGIKTSLFFYSGLDLDARNHLRDYLTQNDYALLINPVQVTTGEGGDVIANVTYNLSLYDVATKQKVWVAILFVPAGSASIFRMYDKMGDSIVKQLIENGLITQNITPGKV